MKIKISRFGSVKPMLYFLGAYIFAYCFYLLTHECGHAIGFLLLGYSDVRIHVTPISGYTTIEVFYFRSDLDMFLIFLAGPLINLLLASIIFSFFWHKRNHYLLPLFMYSSIAFLQEGTVILNCFLNGSEIIYDFDTLMFLGLSPVIVAIICGVVLSAGFIITFMIWPIFEISPSDSFFRKLIINLGFIVYSIPIIFLLPLIVPIGPVTQFYLNFIYLLSFSFFLLRIAIYRKIFPLIDRIAHTDVQKISWINVWYSLSLGILIFVFLLIFFN